MAGIWKPDSKRSYWAEPNKITLNRLDVCPHFQVQTPAVKMQAAPPEDEEPTCSCPTAQAEAAPPEAPREFPQPQQLRRRPGGGAGLPGCQDGGGGTAQLGTAENGVLVLLSSNPGPDEHCFVCVHTPVVTTGPGISAWGWGRFRARLAAFWPQLTLEWTHSRSPALCLSSGWGMQAEEGKCVGINPKVRSSISERNSFQT